MIRSIPFVLALVLMALASCAAPTQPAQETQPQSSPQEITVLASPTAVPTVVLLTPDWTRFPRLQAGSQGVSQDARAIKDWMRQEIGLREQLGPKADEIFRLMDQAETEALQDALQQLKTGNKPKGMPAPLPPRGRRALGAQQFLAFTDALVALSRVPELISRPEYRDPDRTLPATETDKEIRENVRAHVKLQPTVTGCHAEMDVEVTIEATGDGVVYKDTAKGHVSMTICPDEEGKVPLDFDLNTEVNVNGILIRLHITDHAIGHVDDEGNLASIDDDVEAELDLPTGKDWFTGAPTNSSARVGLQITRGGLGGTDPKSVSTTVTGSQVLDASFPPNQDVAIRAGQLGFAMVTLLEDAAFKLAQEKWQDNYCVTIKGVDERQRVQVGSETSFTARVPHQFEGKDLALPVIATLTTGKVSVTPSGTKLPAPATFRYKAPDEAGEEATVELVSRSRRGIGRINVTFYTEQEYLRVDSAIGAYEAKVPMTGDICALDKAFRLKVYGTNAAGLPYDGEIAFAPAGKEGGSWKHTATSCTPISGCGKVTGTGTYQVQGLETGKPVIKMNSTTATSSIKGYTATYDWPAWQFDLEHEMGVCRSQ